MKLLGWALIQYDWCPYTKGEFGQRRMQREDDVKLLMGRMPCEDGGQRDAPTSQGMPNTHLQMYEKEAKKDFPTGFRGSRALLNLWFWTSNLQNCENKFLFLLLLLSL